MGLSPKTNSARTYIRYTQAINTIEDCMDSEMVERFYEYRDNTDKDRKRGLSIEQVIKLSQEPEETIRQTVSAVLDNPDKAKAIVNDALGGRAETKITVTLPKEVADYYANKADSFGVSRGYYITYLLTGLAHD